MKKKAEIIWALVFIVFASVFYYLTLGLKSSLGPDVGGAFYPRLLVYATLLLSLKLLHNAFKRDNNDNKKLFNFEDNGFLNVILVISTSFVYLYFLKIVGFLILTPLYLFLLLTIIEAKKITQRILISIVTTAVVFLIFQKFLDIPFPSGILI